MDKLLFSAVHAVRSLFTRGMLKLFITSILVTLAALVAFVFGSSVFFSWLAQLLHGHAYAFLLPWLGSIGSSLIAWLLFPGIMPLIISFFDDTIAKLIEEEDYPDAAQGHAREFWVEFGHDLRFSLKAIALNILVLPLYLVPVLNLFLFYLLNGYLLGREFFCMIARRHLHMRETEALYRHNSTIIITAGIALCVLATVPIANLFAPFWGIAVMVHLYHRLEPGVKLERITTGNSFNNQ